MGQVGMLHNDSPMFLEYDDMLYRRPNSNLVPNLVFVVVTGGKTVDLLPTRQRQVVDLVHSPKGHPV